MLKAIFPCITKSKLKENGVFILSVKGVKFDLQPGENIRFADINKYVPQQWNVLENTTTTLTLGYLSIEKFNGNSVLMELKIGSDRLIGLFVAGKAINLSDFFIGKSITFTLKSLKGLFKSLRTVGLCYGATLETNESDIFSSSKLCVKEICLTDTKSKTVIRHVECLRTVQINSQSHTCIKCSEHKRHKKYDQSKMLLNSDKENVNPATQQKTDVTDQLRKIAPNLSENQILLITSQIESSSHNHSKGVRWPKEIICMALTIYNRNPSAYKDITRNGWLNLPSESLLYLYKNAVKQKPGIIPTMMAWMKNEAVRLRVETEGYYGGVLLDEMSIQEDLQIVNHGNGTSLFGLVDCEPEVMLMHCSNEGKCESKLANHVMQYIFHGITGFRWPFANYPNAQAAPADIFITTWKCIDALYEWGFKPIYLCMDGSSNNRAFLKMHFPENDPLLTKMVASHYKNPLRKMIFIMDPCHLIKKNP
ncbi:Hypothetical predicted protein [Mytilus galloprovincialis]|uniref:Transposable element P transposase-like RNase H domain-containing protein n=1 Tax=Mytilus galloprovincialis TaxID=29158 RepID=A0A8B6CGP9_MYTGA|nr:Hypothetical predicted protein [Mytilus galloprovincialis]